MSKLKIQENIGLFQCPLCGSKMEVMELKSLVCSENHCFDFSKSGYVNFLLRPHKAQYDKGMFRSRSLLCKKGFFDPMIEKICEIILRGVEKAKDEKLLILDAGCGEGSHLYRAIRGLSEKGFPRLVGAGIDISKEGIQIAAKEYPDHIWCVGDLAKSPFADGKFDVLLNILTPSNYAEFNRILSYSGMLIKVVPGPHYLGELRECFYEKTDKQSYSNERVVERFHEGFCLLDKQRVSYQVKLDAGDLDHLIRMTPLSWGASDEKVEQAIEAGIDRITVDLVIMYGEKK